MRLKLSNMEIIKEVKMKKILFVPLDWHRDKEGHFDDVKNALAKQCEVMIYDGDVIPGVTQFKPDVILFQGSLTPFELKTIKASTGAKVIMYTGDAGYVPPQSFMEQKESVDLFLIPFLDTMRTYGKTLEKPINYLWEFIQDWRFKEPKDMKDGDIVFVGNKYDHLPGGEIRTTISEFLNKHLQGIHFFGSGFCNGGIEYEKTPELYNNSFITIAENNLVLSGYFTPRNIGGMAAGSCVLHKWFPNIENFFRHLEDGMVYRNEYELLQQINFLKANPEIRNQLARKSYETAKQYWSLDSWVKNLLTTIDKFEESLKPKESER